MLQTILKNILAYIKINWRSIATAVVVAFAVYGVYTAFRRNQDDFATKMQRLREAHDAEVSAILAARDVERKEHEENLKRLQNTLDETRRQYDADIKTLTEKKQRQVTQLVVKYGDDPTEMARQVAEVTGFQLVIPE